MLLRRVQAIGPHAKPLELAEIPEPELQDGEVLVEVSVCGVCHTELDEIEGRVPPPRLPIVLGHQVIGVVAQCQSTTTNLRPGDRVGVGWIHSSSGNEDENISDQFCATGRDVNGGYAHYMSVPAEYAYPIPHQYSDAEAAPLLCAGAIGYRALRLTGLKSGERIGLIGFGGSNHLVLQIARHLYPDSSVYVFARSAAQRDFAIELGADWAGDIKQQPPAPLDALIDTTPAWKPVLEGLSKLRPGGRLVINAIRKEDSDKETLLDLSYHRHLWMEREIKSVANITGRDISAFLPLAASAGIRPEIQEYPLEDANRALIDLKHGRIHGAKVLIVK